MELKVAKEQVEACINLGKQRCTDILTKTTVQTKQSTYLFTLNSCDVIIINV